MERDRAAVMMMITAGVPLEEIAVRAQRVRDERLADIGELVRDALAQAPSRPALRSGVHPVIATRLQRERRNAERERREGGGTAQVPARAATARRSRSFVTSSQPAKKPSTETAEMAWRRRRRERLARP